MSGYKMNMTKYTAFIEKDEDMYVAKCIELGTVSQGDTIEEALDNLKEATELYLEEMPKREISDYSFTTTFEVGGKKSVNT